ncbi:anthocyanidin-3-O-glucoside rhamnosyltransferase isoform X2 [Cryptomeria japonica]|uniref:anthocyanidin-3-O-glucoside rhamnosyltransferase isoform X2 n=1 Tax=Cryptomeria japonica TaxID=3369 RepID=UPI0027DA607B|nr:anthocyanidin-3-O-glucoside rhamnosyltransferase isoform X2 [Cryptomeria japonica]
MGEEKQRELRVVMFPWLAHGHITPFVELAKSLATHGLKIFFVSTPLNIKRIEPQICDAPDIDLVELAMPTVKGLPPGVECSVDVVKRAEAPLLVPLLITAMDLLEKPFAMLLQKLSPDFVIYDVMQHWVPRVANPIPTILFLTMGTAGSSYWEGELDMASGNPTAEDLTLSPAGFPSPNIHLTLFEARRAHFQIYEKHAGDLSVIERASICLRESWAVACNTCLELEGVYVEYLQSLVKRPVIPVGLLMRELPPLPIVDICLQWLDRQPAASVVVLSFGSEYNLTHKELAPIAMGLLETSVSFIWVLPAGIDLLPGFQDQIGVYFLLIVGGIQ